MNSKRFLTLNITLLCFVSIILGQKESPRIFSDLEYAVQMQGNVSCGDNNPLWLNANKYGLSSLENNNGYLRAGLFRNIDTDSLRKWGIAYGVDLVAPVNYTSKFVIQQAYFEGRYKKGVLTIGSKQHQPNLKNAELSTGSQTLGINARPFPEVRIELPEYWQIPGLKGWLGFRGHLAYGRQTDDKWQKSFTDKQYKFTENTLYHSKSGFLKIGPDDKPVQFEFGLEMGCQFGGTSYIFKDETEFVVYENSSKLIDFWHALIPNSGGAGDIGEGKYANTEGNHVGSWMARLSYKTNGWKFAVYADHYFDDHSQMLFLDYDGYGKGEEWDSKKDARFFMYKFKDCMWGVEVNMPKNPFISNFVGEYLYTKDQSGAVFHDHTPTISDHIAGRDDYYNHYIYTGWQHWGQVIGNPLYRSPLYNENGEIRIQNTRFWAWHVAMNGDPLPSLHWRWLTTWQKGWGTYNYPYDNPENNLSMMAEVTWTADRMFKASGWQISGAFAFDRGDLLGDNTGIQLTITKRFK